MGGGGQGAVSGEVQSVEIEFGRFVSKYQCCAGGSEDQDWESTVFFLPKLGKGSERVLFQNIPK